MNGFKKCITVIHRLCDGLEKALETICGACLIAGTVMMLVEINFRYIVGVSVIWAEEFVRFVNIWFVFLFVGPLARRASHLSVTALYAHFPRTIRRSLKIFFPLLNIAVCILLVWWGIYLVYFLLEMGMKSATGTIFHPWTWRLSIPVSMAIAIFFIVDYLLTYLREEDS